MKHVFFANTPAHVHLYKNAVAELDDRGHDVIVFGRDHGCARDLLEYHDLPFLIYGTRGETKRSLAFNAPKHYVRVVQEARRIDPDLIFGMGAYAAPTGVLSRTPVVAIQDSEPHRLDYLLSRPLVRAFLTPHAFRENLGAKHHRFYGYKECAYLHPDVFDPDPGIREHLGLDPDESYAIVRFNSLGAYHDVGVSGFDRAQRRRLVETLARHATVLVSDEGMTMEELPAGVRPFDLHPALMHDAIAAADLLVADTQTMATEAALLGTPAIRSNSFVGDDDMGNFIELERCGLLHNTTVFGDVLSRATTVLTDEKMQATWKRRCEEYMRELTNLTDLIVSIATAPDPMEPIAELEAERPPAGRLPDTADPSF